MTESRPCVGSADRRAPQMIRDGRVGVAPAEKDGRTHMLYRVLCQACVAGRGGVDTRGQSRLVPSVHNHSPPTTPPDPGSDIASAIETNPSYSNHSLLIYTSSTVAPAIPSVMSSFPFQQGILSLSPSLVATTLSSAGPDAR